MDILDLASGTGEHIGSYIERGISKITVVDKNINSLDALKERYKDNLSMFEFICADIFEYKFTKKYDLIFLGDNTIQFFKSYCEQYNILSIISNQLKSTGCAIINITPLDIDNILRYGNQYVESQVGNEMVNIQLDVFEQNLIYKFTDGATSVEIQTRFLLKQEFLDMLSSLDMFIHREENIICKNGDKTKFYFIKHISDS